MLLACMRHQQHPTAQWLLCRAVVFCLLLRAHRQPLCKVCLAPLKAGLQEANHLICAHVQASHAEQAAQLEDAAAVASASLAAAVSQHAGDQRSLTHQLREMQACHTIACLPDVAAMPPCSIRM